MPGLWLTVILLLLHLTRCREAVNNQSDRVWLKEWNRLNDTLKNFSSDIEKTTYLREYCAGLMKVGIENPASASSPGNISFENLQLSRCFPFLQSDSIPAGCGLTSYFYIKLLNSFGYRAYQYSFGFTDKPYEAFIHSFALVVIDYKGEKRMIIQDPYLDMSFTDASGAPLDFYRFLSFIKNQQYQKVVAQKSAAVTKLVVADTLLYWPALNDSCRRLMRAKLLSGSGKRVKSFSFLRNYSTMMQSPCNNFEEKFVTALRMHHLNGPFVAACLLRVNTMKGSDDAAGIQKSIDSLLSNSGVNKPF